MVDFDKEIGMARAKPTKSTGYGQKVDTLYYDVEQMIGNEPEDLDEDEGMGPDRRRVVNRKVSIDLFMTKTFSRKENVPPPAETVDLGFTLACAETGDVVHGFDCQVMIKAMRAKLDHRFAIKWESWYLVRIDRARIYGRGMGTGLEFSYSTIERGVALDGSVLMRRYNEHHGAHQSIYVIEPWPKQIKEKGKVVATIVASNENTMKLETFQSKIDELRKFLAELVTPERLEQTLLAAASDQFLALSHDGVDADEGPTASNPLSPDDGGFITLEHA